MTTQESTGQPQPTEAEKVLKEEAEKTRKLQQDEQDEPAGQGQACGVNADQEGLGGPQDPNPQPSEDDAKPEKDEQA